jgi:pilus assembly protein CpaB
MKTKLLLILAIAMGLVTTFLFYNYMKQYDVETIVNESMVDVIVAKKPIMKNQMVTSEMIETIQLPEKALHPQTVRNSEDIFGKYATSNLEVGEQILDHRLQSEREETLFVSRKVQEGYRAVSIGVNFVQSVSTLIEPDDYVDVVATEVIKRGEQDDVKTELILQKVRVLAVGRKLLQPNSEEEYVEYSSVTLELKPTDSVKLINASERGNLQLLLHSRVIGLKEVKTDAKQTN